MYELKFEPKEEKDLLDLLEAGEGNYEVIKSVFGHSKRTGNPMITLTLKVWDKTGNQGLITDYLMISDKNFALRKIRHFCFSNGLQEAYERGGFNADECEGRCGKLIIGIEKGQPREDNPNESYPDKNKAVDYISSNGAEKKQQAEGEKLDDDIPF